MTSEELRALADAASQGPWFVRVGLYDDGGKYVVGIKLGGDDYVETDGGFYGPRLENATLIATLGPDAARLLADAIDELEAGKDSGRMNAPPILVRFAALGKERPDDE